MNDSLEWLNNFLSICCSVDLHESSEQLQNVVQILKDRYVNNYRHRYSSIAALLKRSPYNDYSSDQFDMLRLNMRYIEQNFDILGFTDEARQSSIKLFDHLILEVDRIINIDRRIEQIQAQEKKNIDALAALKDNELDVSQFLAVVTQLIHDSNTIESKTNENEIKLQSLSDQYKELSDRYSSFGKNLQTAKSELRHMESRIEGFNTQSITILSIFTAIVFAFTGGFTMLGSAFSNLTGITRNESILLISIVIIVGCILFDIIYFLLNFIGKMSKIQLSGNCNLDCDNCKIKNGDTTCRGIIRFRNRHHTIKWINIIAIIVVASILIINMFFITPPFSGQTIGSKASEINPLPSTINESTTTSIVTAAPTIIPSPTPIARPLSDDT